MVCCVAVHQTSDAINLPQLTFMCLSSNFHRKSEAGAASAQTRNKVKWPILKWLINTRWNLRFHCCTNKCSMFRLDLAAFHAQANIGCCGGGYPMGTDLAFPWLNGKLFFFTKIASVELRITTVSEEIYTPCSQPPRDERKKNECGKGKWSAWWSLEADDPNTKPNKFADAFRLHKQNWTTEMSNNGKLLSREMA